jgi:hypothetical protein
MAGGKGVDRRVGITAAVVGTVRSSRHRQPRLQGTTVALQHAAGSMYLISGVCAGVCFCCYWFLGAGLGCSRLLHLSHPCMWCTTACLGCS